MVIPGMMMMMMMMTMTTTIMMIAIHTVHLPSGVSDTVAVHCDDPQGSSLGPKIFITYTEEIDEVFQIHKFNHHCFADDPQAYVDVPQSHVGAVASQIQNCLEWCTKITTES